MNTKNIHKNSGLKYPTPEIQYEKDSIKPKILLNHKYIQNLNTCKDRAYFNFRYFSFSCLINKRQ